MSPSPVVGWRSIRHSHPEQHDHRIYTIGTGSGATPRRDRRHRVSGQRRTWSGLVTPADRQPRCATKSRRQPRAGTSTDNGGPTQTITPPLDTPQSTPAATPLSSDVLGIRSRLTSAVLAHGRRNRGHRRLRVHIQSRTRRRCRTRRTAPLTAKPSWRLQPAARRLYAFAIIGRHAASRPDPDDWRSAQRQTNDCRIFPSHSHSD